MDPKYRCDRKLIKKKNYVKLKFVKQGGQDVLKALEKSTEPSDLDDIAIEAKCVLDFPYVPPKY